MGVYVLETRHLRRAKEPWDTGAVYDRRTILEELWYTTFGGWHSASEHRANFRCRKRAMGDIWDRPSVGDMCDRKIWYKKWRTGSPWAMTVRTRMMSNTDMGSLESDVWINVMTYIVESVVCNHGMRLAEWSCMTFDTEVLGTHETWKEQQIRHQSIRLTIGKTALFDRANQHSKTRLNPFILNSTLQ